MISHKPKKKSTQGYGYVGTWNDGTLGWSVPEFLYPAGKGKSRQPSTPDAKGWNDNETHYLCRITITLMKDSKGRLITRKVKPDKP